jgi:hypothetical protein
LTSVYTPGAATAPATYTTISVAMLVVVDAVATVVAVGAVERVAKGN